MSKKPDSATHAVQPMIYEIRLKGHLGREWTDWFDGMAVHQWRDCKNLLDGSCAVQPSLEGLLKKVRDLGLPLLAVQCVEPP